LVVNKVDHLSDSDRDLAVAFVSAGVEGLLDGRPIELFAVSAREGDGVQALRRRLVRLAGEEREQLLLASVGGLAAAAAADGVRAAQFEARAIELPLAELRRRTALFEQRIAELGAANAEADDLLERGVARALATLVDEPLLGYAGAEERRLRAALHGHVAELDGRSPRALSIDLERWVDATVQREFAELVPRFEAAVAEGLMTLQRPHTARVTQILHEVQAVAEDVFGSRVADGPRSVGLSAPSRFSFKLDDPEHALDAIVGFSRTIAPGRLGRRLVVREGERRLAAMTDRHAGRLRSELVERARGAVREHRHELAGRVEEATGAIRVAIDRASAEHQRGERDGRLRLRELTAIGERCISVAAELAAVGAVVE
jgi:hypothetical protein